MSQASSTALFDILEKLAQRGIPGGTATHLFDIGTKDYLNFFQKEFISESALHGNAICRFFEGPYGSGKTHLLSLLSNLGEQNSFAVVRVDLSQALDIADWEQVTKFILENLQLRTDQGMLKGLPKILEHLAQTNMPNGDVLFEQRLPHPGFARAMHHALFMSSKSSEYKRCLSDFLSGSKALVSDLKRIGITGVKGHLVKRNADQVLKTALNGLFLLGIPTMILVDENDRTLDAVGSPALKRKKSLAANLIRRLIDACTSGGINGAVIVFTVLPAFIDMCALEYPALGQRLRTVPPDDIQSSWRSTVLTVEDVNSASHPEVFAKHAVTRFSEIYCEVANGNVSGSEIIADLQKQADEVLRNTAGAGYRRELMKALASKVLRKLDEV